MELDKTSSGIISKMISSYYSKCREIPLKRIGEREFGFGTFDRKIAYRHYAFKDYAQLRDYLVSNAPPFVSISSAYYEKPDARPMENKIWKGSELIFDLDASDLDLECRRLHGSSWVCDKCLDTIKLETLKLIEEFLIPDFGFKSDDMHINFSGNRGYHIHIDNEIVRSMSSEERKEISDYIKGIGINVSEFFPAMGVRGVQLEGPRPTDGGWAGKLARGAIKFINSGPTAMMATGMDKKLAMLIERNKAAIIFGISMGNWDKIHIPKKDYFWSSVLGSISIKQADSIDKNVTVDIRHLIRLPNTIHGDTGLLALSVGSARDLAKFDPTISAVAFKNGDIKIKMIKKNPEFSINGKSYGELKDIVEIDIAAAAYLTLKGYSQIV